MPAFDPSEDVGDMAVLAIEREAALRIVPGQAGQAALDRRDGEGRGAFRRRCQIGQVEPDHFGRRGEGIRSLQSAPTREVLPVGGISFVGVLGGRGPGVIAGIVDQPVEGAGAGDLRGQGDPIAVRVISLVALSNICCVGGR